MTIGDYARFIVDENFAIEDQDNRLLIKSGGGKYNVEGDKNKQKRNRHFGLDYFIEDLEIKSYAGPSGSNGGSTNTSITFKIKEPYGLTLLNNLVLAANDFKIKNYLDQPYLLKVFMVGYDEHSVLQSDKYKKELTRYIPIRFSEFKFGVSHVGSEYEVTAYPYNSTALQSHKAAIPTDVQIEAKTINDFFNVDVQVDVEDEIRETESLPPLTLNATKSEKGLAGYLNRLEMEYVKQGKKEVPDVYSFKIDSEIGTSQIVAQEAIDLSKAANTKDPNLKAKQLFDDFVNFDKTTKSYSIRAGTTILNTINSLIRTSEYMTNQVKDIEKKYSSETA